MAATIHEVGKISVPLDILSKPGNLSEPHPDNPDRFPASRKTKWVWLPIGVVRRRDFTGSKNLGSSECFYEIIFGKYVWQFFFLARFLLMLTPLLLAFRCIGLRGPGQKFDN